MGLFGKKKIQDKAACRCCDVGCTPEGMAQAEKDKASIGIKVLGSGCSKCKALEEATRAALSSLGMKDAVEHIADFAQIAAYGVMTTPALVVDGKVVSYGKVLKNEEVEAILKKARGLSDER